MTSPDPLTPEQEEIAARVRALPAPQPEAAFRARAKQAFLEPGSARAAAPAPARIRPAWWVAGTLAVAAGLVLYVLLRPEPGWRVLPGGGPLTADGLTHRSEELAGLRLRHGTRLTTEDREVMLRLGDRALLSIGPQSSITLGGVPGRDPDALLASLHEGELGFLARPDFAGPLLLRSDEARVRVLGTCLSLWRGADGTCVCVLEGSVEVDALLDSEPGRAVPGETRWVLYRDGRTSELEELVPEHRGTVERLLQKAASEFED